MKDDKVKKAYRELIKAAKEYDPLPMAVVHPCNEDALEGTLEAVEENLIDPILIAPEAKLKDLAKKMKVSLKGLKIVDVPHSHAAAEMAAQMAKSGEVKALMKGSLHTAEYLHPILTHLRTERRLSHVYVIVPKNYDHPLIITDAAINIHPDLLAKADIVQNAIDLAHDVMGLDKPKVAILSAVETINPAINSTIEAAALCKMADRGQITGGLLDGPLGFDNAINPEAVKAKGIKSDVAGDADILVAPDLEAANLLAKQMIFMGKAGAAGVALGARVPVVLTSRADGAMSRSASCALAVLMAHKMKFPKGVKV